MLYIPTSFIVATMLITIAGEKLKSSRESVSDHSNNSSLHQNASEVGVAWADADNPDCENHTCVRKCCEENKVFSFDQLGCDDPLPDEPSLNIVFKSKDGRPVEAANPVLLLTGFPYEITNCSMGPLPSHRSGHLLADGTFYTAYDNTYRDNLHYCLVIIRNEGEPSKMTPLTCFTEFVETSRTIFRYYAHSIGLTLSCIALTIVVLCHALVPKLRDLQGKCLLSHACSLLVGSMALLTATLWQSSSNWQCVAIGFIIHTAYIATYMWLTVMCFDIWRFVRMNVKGIPLLHVLGGKENKIFLSYCAVAWGVTGVIALITCTLQFLPDDALPDYIIRPHIGVNRCFIIEDDANLFVYFFLILGTLSVLNVLLVGTTAHYLYKAGIPLCCCPQRWKTHTELPAIKAKHLEIFRQRFLIFVTTVLIWTTEVLSFKIPPKEIWELTDLLNTLQGVFILLIFLREKKKRDLVLVMLRNVFNRVRKGTETVSPSEQASNTVVSATFLSDKLEGSDKGKAERAQIYSQENETAGSASPKNNDQVGMQSMDEIDQVNNQGQLATLGNKTSVQ